MNGLLPLIIVMVAILWLFMIRPQRRRQQTQKAMIDNLKIGDEIMTAGGFYGTISAISEDEVSVELAPGMDARLAKRAIALVVADEVEDEDVEDADDGEPDELVAETEERVR